MSSITRHIAFCLDKLEGTLPNYPQNKTKNHQTYLQLVKFNIDRFCAVCEASEAVKIRECVQDGLMSHWSSFQKIMLKWILMLSHSGNWQINSHTM